MPYYDYLCERCGEQFEYNVPYQDRDQSRECPECGGELDRMISSPKICYDSFTVSGRKPDEGFKDRLREIKKTHRNNNFEHLI